MQAVSSVVVSSDEDDKQNATDYVDDITKTEAVMIDHAINDSSTIEQDFNSLSDVIKALSHSLSIEMQLVNVRRSHVMEDAFRFEDCPNFSPLKSIKVMAII